MFETLIHRWLRVPYQLHVRTGRAKGKYTDTVVFLHGLGNSGAAWDKVIAQLPPDVRAVSIDLLGFGQSPRPEWAVYDVRTQARSVITTLIRLRLTGRVVLVGHSLGGLVAVEVAKRYPLAVRSLILCSPPFYDPQVDSNRLLRTAFRRLQHRPDRFIKLAGLAMKYNLVNRSFHVTEENIEPYFATLGASILTQTSLEDAKALKKPMMLLLGGIDPWVKKRNLKAVVEANPRAKLRSFVAGHEIRGPYVQQVVQAVSESVRTKS